MSTGRNYDDKLLFVGTHGHVLAIDKQSGRSVWELSLPGTGYTIVSILYEDGVLYAGSKGLLFAIDPSSGNILWQNGLDGMGYGHITMTTTRQTKTDPVTRFQQDEDDQRDDD